MSGVVKEVSAEYRSVRQVDDCPVGYKRSEVGVIPKDWSPIKLEELAELTSSKRIFEDDYVQDGIPFYRGQEISQLLAGEKLVVKCYVSKEKYMTLKNSFGAPKRGDILITAVGTLGNAYLIDTDLPFYFKDGNLIWLRKVKDIIQGRYLVKQMEWLKPKILEGAIGSSQKALTIVVLKKLIIPTPSEKEQTAIANALSDLDALITSLEKLITKKRTIKTAAMQQLLTGKKRLPPFDKFHTGYKQTELGEIPEDWEVKRVNQLTSNIIDYRGVTPKKIGMEWGGGDIVALSAGNVKKGYIDFEAESYFGSEALYKRWMRNGDVKKGDVVFTMEAPLGNIAIIPDERKYILSQRTILLQFNRNVVSSMYLYQLIMSEEFQSNLSDKGTGSTAQGIKRATFELLELPLPSYEEQVLIADILADMDKEIETIEQRLTKTQQLKQGMMQELLTGRIRLI